MNYAPPPTSEPRDTIPAPPPWDVADDRRITTPGVPPWFDEIGWDDGWPDVPTLVTASGPAT